MKKQNLLLFTQNVMEAQKEIQSLGGRVTQRFTDAVIAADLPESITAQSLIYSSPTAPSDLDDVSQISVNAWEGRQNLTEGVTDNDPTKSIPWDTPGFQPPRKIVLVIPQESNENDVSESTGTPTSLYMVGSIAVGLILVSGSDPSLTFSVAEQQKVIQEVQEGLNFLATEEPRANVSFVYDIKFITVSVKPGSTTSYESAEAPWRDAALGKMGFLASRQGSIDYAQTLKSTKGTDWAYVAYFTKYPLHHFAYAVSEKLCMEYSNDGWGVNNINQVFAHETCHIFGADDEYGNCVCGSKHGFLSVPNNNCVNCSRTRVPCLMERNELTICQWTRGQIGWDERLFPANLFPITM